MANQPKFSKAMHIVLWIAQAVLAVSLIWSALMKLGQPIETLSAMWPWTSQVPMGLVKLTGLLDLASALGLILPSLLRIKPNLTAVAAMGIVALMVCASIFHITRGEASLIGVNIVFAVIAGFIAWGRLTKVPIRSK